MMKTLISHFLFISLVSFAYSVPPIPFSGKIAINGVNFNGNAKFSFSIIDDQGVEKWRHSDDTKSMIENSVSNGRYIVLLGGQGMNPFPSKLFLNNSNLFLKVHFDNGDGKGKRHLSPDIPITANSFSMASEWSKYSELASGVPSGSITKEMLSSGLRSELELNNSLKPMQVVEGQVIVSFDDTSQKNQIHLYDMENNRTELLTSFEFPDGGWVSYTSFTDDSVLNLNSYGSFLRYDIKTRTFLAPVVLPSQISSPFNYEDSIVGISYDPSLQKNQIFLYDVESNSSQLLETFAFPNNSWSRMTSFAHNDTLWLNAGGGYISYNVKERKFNDLTSLTNNFTMAFAYEGNLIGVSRDGDTEKFQIHLVDLDTNQTKLLSTFEFPEGGWVTYKSFIDGDVLRLRSGDQFINFDLINNQFTAPTNITPIAQSIFPYRYEDNVGIITKDMLSPALRTELFPPLTNEPQINGTLENPYGWDGEIVIGTLDANYTVPAGKVLIITTASPEAFSDGVLFMGSKGNAVIPAGKEVGGIFAGLIVDEVPSITPVLAVNPVGENISLSVPSDKLFVITSGTPVWNTSVSPSSWDFTVDGKTMPLGVGNPAILPAQASIISGIGETYKAGYGNRSSEYGFKAGGFSGYLISPEDLKKLR